MSFSNRIGGRSDANSAIETFARASNGFITTRYEACPSPVSPSAANHVVPAAATHGSAATPDSSPPACDTHPAATHGPNHSISDDDARSVAGTGTCSVEPGSTESDFGASDREDEIVVTRIEAVAELGFATDNVTVQSDPPP